MKTKTEFVFLHKLDSFHFTSGHWCGVYQSCKMSIFLHETKPSNQILPEEKCVNHDRFGTKLNTTNTKYTFGGQLFTYLTNQARNFTMLYKYSAKKIICPNLPISLNGYICHIRDISQHWCIFIYLLKDTGVVHIYQLVISVK